MNRYNKLKKSKFFYRLFSEYDFILTYELDSYVFRNELRTWVAKEYDYIGAPWPPFYVNRENKKDLVRVGNGGFSMRSNKFINMFTKLNLPLYFVATSRVFDRNGQVSTFIKSAEFCIGWIRPCDS